MKNDSLNTIIIRLGKGTIKDGFSHVNIKLNLGTNEWEDSSNLPANPELQQLLSEWQLLYPNALRLRSPGGNLSPKTAVFDTNTVSNVSSQGMVELNANFRIAINDWLNFGDFGRIGRRLRKDLNISDRFSVIIISEELKIWQLPWHFWDLFNDYPHAVEVFAKPRFANVQHIKPQCHGNVNILALSGRDPGSNLDLSFLKTLPQSKPTFEDQAKSASDIAKKLKQVKPTIWVFYGHGDTVNYESFQDGVIYLDNKTPLEISRLRLEIQAAIDRGLQIMIFNCCNGLGLAEQIVDLNIPYIIVMREIIPNITAQEFLENLLEQYSQGQSFPAAFQYARQQLRLGTGGFAQFADWLPILFHNPLSNSVTWQDLSATVFSRFIPAPIVTACRYCSEPQHRIWTNVGLGLLAAILALSLQFQIQIVDWENAIVDRVQATEVKNLPLSPSKVTIVNYDAVDFGNYISNDNVIKGLIDRVKATAKPIVWAIDFEIGNEATIFDKDIIPGCINKNPNNASIKNYSQLAPCDRQLIESVAKLGSNQVALHDFRLNNNLLTGINHQIDRVNLSEILQGSKSESEIKQLFDGKVVIVGYFNPKDINDAKEINYVAIQAIAIDQIIRANDRQHPLPILIFRSIGEQFLWLFSWSILAGILMWNRKWKLLFSIAIGSEITIAGILFMLGQGLPIIVTPISMILVSGAVRGIRSTSANNIDRQVE
jgi:hypothetical protein